MPVVGTDFPFVYTTPTNFRASHTTRAPRIVPLAGRVAFPNNRQEAPRALHSVVLISPDSRPPYEKHHEEPVDGPWRRGGAGGPCRNHAVVRGGPDRQGSAAVAAEEGRSRRPDRQHA